MLSLGWLTALSFISGTPSGWAWGKYLHYADESILNENRAALWDIIIILLTVVGTLTMWHDSGENPLILIAYAFGSGLGTWLIVRIHRHDKEKEHWNEYIRSQSEET